MSSGGGSTGDHLPPEHEHYHFADFASYQLLRRDDDGEYQPVGEGFKTGFCIIDSFPLEGPSTGGTRACEAERQGLTPGWRDMYGAHLFEQWVVLEDWPLAPMANTVSNQPRTRMACSPRGVACESTNNAAITYFTVAGGQIVDERGSPDR